MRTPVPYSPPASAQLYIDVRSESEYAKGHIPSALSMPILDDMERHEVGWLYKNASTAQAKRTGLAYGSAKLQGFFELVEDLQRKNPEKSIIFYCARGGYRSRSVASLFQGIDIPVAWLEGGYKAYRNAVLDTLNRPPEAFPHFITITGLTGVGKSHVLHELEAMGAPCIDLEGLANHRGSHLGTIGTTGGQSVQQFENALAEALWALEAEGYGYCFVEAESRRIGSVFVPKTMHAHMQMGTKTCLVANEAFRVAGLLEDYLKAENFHTEFPKGLERIQRYIPGDVYEAVATAYSEQRYSDVVTLLLTKHYDALYQKSIDGHTYALTVHVAHYKTAAKHLWQWAQEQPFHSLPSTAETTPNPVL